MHFSHAHSMVFARKTIAGMSKCHEESSNDAYHGAFGVSELMTQLAD